MVLAFSSMMSSTTAHWKIRWVRPSTAPHSFNGGRRSERYECAIRLDLRRGCRRSILAGAAAEALLLLHWAMSEQLLNGAVSKDSSKNCQARAQEGCSRMSASVWTGDGSKRGQARKASNRSSNPTV